MPLDIVITTHKPRGISGMKALRVFEKVDSLAQFIKVQPGMSRPLGITEALKFAKQAFYEGDSAYYMLPNNFDGAFVADYLRAKTMATKMQKITCQRSCALFRFFKAIYKAKHWHG